MKSRGWLAIVMPGSSSWMPYAPQGVKGPDGDDETFHKSIKKYVGYRTCQQKYTIHKNVKNINKE